MVEGWEEGVRKRNEFVVRIDSFFILLGNGGDLNMLMKVFNREEIEDLGDVLECWVFLNVEDGI